MKKKVKIILAVLSSLCLSSIAVACSKGGETPSGSTSAYEIASGFEFEEEMTVLQYTPITPEIPLVLLTNGEPVDVVFEVTNSKGEFVEINGGGFIASDKGGYTVRYLAIYEGKILQEKKMKVNVQGSAVSVNVDYEDYIEVGTAVQIQATADEEASFSYEVTCNGTSVSVSDSGVFTPAKAGKYDVKVTATSTAGVKGEYSYSTFARRKGMVGEVETFGEEWNELVKTSSVIRPGWERVTTDDTSLTYGANAGSGLLDRFGQESQYIAFETSGIPEDQTGNCYLNVQVDARYDLAYYEELAAQGYEYLSIWIYIDGQKDHISYIYTDPSYSSQFHVQGGDGEEAENPLLKPGQWTELKLALYDGAFGRKDWKRSFISAYPFYQHGTNFIRIENSAETWNPCGQEPGKMTIYVADIFAVRETARVSVDLAVGETFDAATAVDENGELYVGSGFTYEVYENGTLIPSYDWENLSLGMHDLQIRVMKDGSLYETRGVELAVINTDTAMSLQEVTDNKEMVYSVKNGTKASNLSVEIPAGKTTPHYKVTFGAENNEQPGLKFLPALSKHALQKFSGGYVFFDYYVHGEGISTFKSFVLADDKGTVKGTAVKDQWTTVYVPVDDLIEIYDDFVKGFTAKTHAGKLIAFGNWSGAAGYFYISEVRLAKDIAPVEVVTATASLTADEFTDTYSISEAKIAELGLTGKTLSAELDGVKSQNGTNVAIWDKQEGDVLSYCVYIELPEFGLRQLAYSERIMIIDNTIVREFLPINKNNVHNVQYGGVKDAQLSIVQNPENRTGSYFKVAYSAGENEEPGLKVKPTLDKAILEKYVGGYLKFDIWVDTEQSGLHVLATGTDASGTTYLRTDTLQQKSWNTISISVADVLANYDKLVANFNEATHVGKLCSLVWSWNNEPGTIYYGNFRVEPKIQEMHVEEVPVDYQTAWGNN